MFVVAVGEGAAGVDAEDGMSEPTSSTAPPTSAMSTTAEATTASAAR